MAILAMIGHGQDARGTWREQGRESPDFLCDLREILCALCVKHLSFSL